MNEHLFIKVTVYFPFSFGKKISTTQDIASTEISYQFLAPKVPLLIWGEIKPPTPVLQPIHFQLQRKALYYASVNSSWIWQLKSPHPRDLPSKEKKNANARGSARGELTDALGNLFKLVRFAITFARAVCRWG